MDSSFPLALRATGSPWNPVPCAPVGWTRAVGGQAVATVFALAPLPLLPLRSVFVSQGPDGRGRVVALRRLHWRSVLVGYARWWLAFLGLVGLVYALLHDPTHAWVPATMLLTCRALGVLGFSGRRESGRRAVLGLAAGINAYPDWLPRAAAERIYARLVADWRCTQPTGTLVDWRAFVDADAALDPVLVPLLFALASYAQELEPDAGSLRRRARTWDAAARSWVPYLEGRAAAPAGEPPARPLAASSAR